MSEYRDIKKPKLRKTMIGQSMSPNETPRASEIDDFDPPETVLAIIATQTGPGVRNKIINAPK